MTAELIFDYIENIYGTTPTKVMHVEDFIEMSPVNPDEQSVVYSLYHVDYRDITESPFIQIFSNSANVVIPATKELMTELFPDHAEPPFEPDEPNTTRDN